MQPDGIGMGSRKNRYKLGNPVFPGRRYCTGGKKYKHGTA
jgi:hypothetical protein